MVYVFPIKNKHADIIDLMDTLIDVPNLIIKDNKKLMNKIGIHAKALRKKKILHISFDPKLNESTVILKVNNFYIPGVVKKRTNNHRVEYFFKSTAVPNITLPTVKKNLL